jgi:hypothetical protein
MRKIVFLLILVLLSCSVIAEEFYPTTISGLETRAKLWGDGTISDLRTGQEITLKTLTFQESDFQEVNVVSEVLRINGKEILPEYVLDEFNNKYVKFTITENGSFVYELVADIKTQALVFEVNDYTLGTAPQNLASFLSKSETIESDSSEIITVAAHKLNSNSFLETLNDTIFWVNDYVEYARDNEFQLYYSQQRSSIETLLSKKGVCDEFANLAAGILRAKGIPTRLATGLSFDGTQWGNHAWIEVYHNEVGWIPSDPTFRESGFVDATHIKIGSFNDVTLSQTKAVYPSNSEIVFSTNKLPEVTIKNKEYFSHVTLAASPNELNSGRWNEIKLKVKNNTQNTVNAPIRVRTNEAKRSGITKVACLDLTDCLFVDETKKSVTLLPGEEKELTFGFYPDIDLKENEILTTHLIFDSLAEPLEHEIVIRHGELIDNGLVTVKDLTPITTTEKLMLEILVGNNKPRTSIISISLTGTDTNFLWSETLSPFELANFRKEIPLTATKFLVTIETESEIYSQTIYPIIRAASTPITPDKTVIIQKIPNKPNADPVKTVFDNPELILLASLVLVAFVLLVVIAMRKRYV